MKKLICSWLTLGLALFVLTTSYAQEGTNIDSLRAADVNADGIINILDLVSIASYLDEMPTSDIPVNPDVNGDGKVNILDLVLVASHLGETVRLPVAFVSVNPVPETQLEIDGTIVLTFDGTPEDVAVNIGVAKVVDNSVTLSGPFPPGPLVLIVTWADGTQTLPYTVRQPATFVSATPAPGGTLDVDGTIVLTFSTKPEAVTLSVGTAETIGQRVKITGPFEPGSLILRVTWADGSQTLQYTVREPDTEPPQITDIAAIDSDGNIEPKPTQNTVRIEITFNETVIGQVILRTAAGTNVGWSSKVEGNKALVERGYAKALNSGFSYRMDGNVSDTAGNESSFTIEFTTAGHPDIPVLVTDATFGTVVLESELPVVVEFYAEW